MLEQYRVLADGCRNINGVNGIGNASKADMFMGAIEEELFKCERLGNATCFDYDRAYMAISMDKISQ